MLYVCSIYLYKHRNLKRKTKDEKPYAKNPTKTIHQPLKILTPIPLTLITLCCHYIKIEEKISICKKNEIIGTACYFLGNCSGFTSFNRDSNVTSFLMMTAKALKVQGRYK